LRGDAWALEVQSRLMTCCDLVAEEAIYGSFYRNFANSVLDSFRNKCI